MAGNFQITPGEIAIESIQCEGAASCVTMEQGVVSEGIIVLTICREAQRQASYYYMIRVLTSVA